MNFGVRLPGPFRVGVSSKGRVSAGVTVGPFSVSTGAAARTKSATPSAVRLPGTVAELVVQAVAEGWTVTGQEPHAALLRRGRDSIRLDQVAPALVEVSPTVTRTLAVIVALTFGAPFLLCFLWLAPRVLL